MYAFPVKAAQAVVMALEKASVDRLSQGHSEEGCSKEMMKGRRSSGREGGNINTGPV